MADSALAWSGLGPEKWRMIGSAVEPQGTIYQCHASFPQPGDWRGRSRRDLAPPGTDLDGAGLIGIARRKEVDSSSPRPRQLGSFVCSGAVMDCCVCVCRRSCVLPSSTNEFTPWCAPIAPVRPNLLAHTRMHLCSGAAACVISTGYCCCASWAFVQAPARRCAIVAHMVCMAAARARLLDGWGGRSPLSPGLAQ